MSQPTEPHEGHSTDGTPVEGTNAEEAEPLRRDLVRDPEQSSSEAVEDSADYERAVEDGTAAPAAGQDDPGAGELAPEFREPGS